jgi:hypothetical protein
MSTKSREQCEGCAFKPGAAANREPYNLLRSEVCALGAIPFFCHHSIDWKNRKMDSASIRADVRIAGICQGWKRRVGELRAEGYFVDVEKRRTRRFSAMYILGVLDEWIEQKDPTEKKILHSQLREALRLLKDGIPRPRPRDRQVRACRTKDMEGFV